MYSPWWLSIDTYIPVHGIPGSSRSTTTGALNFFPPRYGQLDARTAALTMHVSLRWPAETAADKVSRSWEPAALLSSLLPFFPVRSTRLCFLFPASGKSHRSTSPSDQLTLSTPRDSCTCPQTAKHGRTSLKVWHNALHPVGPPVLQSRWE